MKRIIQSTFGLLLLLATTETTWAAIVCTPMNGSPRTDIVQLSPGNISAGEDIPLGTVIYQGRWYSGAIVGKSVISCASPVDTSFWLNVAWGLENAPLPLSSWTGSSFGSAVYETGIQGVGIAISQGSDGRGATLGQPVYKYPNDFNTLLTSGFYQPYLADNNIFVSLIKIGPMNAGSHNLEAVKLPSANITLINPLRHPITSTGLPIKAIIVKFQGQMTVNTQTCTTPHVNVNLGSYDIQHNFTGTGSTTPWIDASIMLTNCPKFYGFYNAANSTLMFDYSTGKGIVATSTSNSIGVRLTPVGDTINSANGIMAIDPTVSGAASGVGIQLGWGSNSQTPILFDFLAEKTMTLPKDGTSTIRVPLSARYIQTATTPTPGKANGKVEFTINYY
ncbi:fimbrial protein [Edaphovirga cremea]|uniref:fimbrial protein n=1 Tax=Edaphovirga cremea TaxID=2267246 RepID=UPI000DEFD098|nr:fimbrial protein [Edaphovirga cremea]